MSDIKRLPDSIGYWIEESQPQFLYLVNRPEFTCGSRPGSATMYDFEPGRWLKVELPTFPPREKAPLRLCWATHKASGNRHLMVYAAEQNHFSSACSNWMGVLCVTDIVWLTPEYLDEFKEAVLR